MNNQDIIALINNGNSPETTAANLIELFETNREDFSRITFSEGQNIFHHLLLNKKTKIIELMIEHEGLIKLCDIPDNFGQTVLHYLAKTPDLDPVFMEKISKRLSHLLNTQDEHGNTTLHVGVVNDNTVWIQTLMNEPGVNRVLANAEQKTPYDLTSSPLIHSLLRSIDLSKIKLSNLPDEEVLATQRKEMRDTFPLLSSNDRGALASSSSPVLSDSNGSLTSSSSQSSCDSSSPRRDSSYRENLIELLSQDPCEYNKLLQTFCSHCLGADIDADDQLKTLLLNSRKNIRLLNDAQTVLSPILQAQEYKFQQEKKQLQTSFLETLSMGGLFAVLPPPITPDFSHIDSEKPRQLLSSLWLICAGQDTVDSERNLDLIQLKYCAIGLHNSKPLNDLLTHLNSLFPSFDHYQKLFANYLVWQLISRNLALFYDPENPVWEQWGSFKQQNASNDSGLGELGRQLNESIDMLISRRAHLCNSKLLKNWQTLMTLSCHSVFNQEKLSFGQLVQDAISAGSSEQAGLINTIAGELKKHGKSWYQRLSTHPFESEEGQAVISENARYFDQLFDYFSYKVLKPDAPVKRQSALKFLLRLAQQLYASDGDMPRDLNHFKLVFQVIDSPPISRLKSLFSEWSPHEQLIWKEMKKFITEGNEKWIRQTIRVEADSLSPVCNFAKDYEFARQNETPVYRLAMCGKALEPLEQSAQIVQFDSSVYHSDLPGYFNDYVISSAKERDARSCRIQPREKMDVLNLSESAENIAEDLITTMTDFKEDFLNRGVIPGVVWGKRTRPAAEITDVLMNWAQTRLSALDKTQIQAPLKEFNSTMLYLTKVINQYDHSNHPVKINPLSMMDKLNQLKSSLLNADSRAAAQSSSCPEKKSSGSGMSRFFQRRLSFRGDPHGASSSTPSRKS
ncbi:RasGEF domain-containing protein [Legionella sp. CNM-4043-24]|uniref:RasGEF domain-containing protein n=1 Tax=Legionella sp. CNM-4043-24 TaxID=3421646 RepID=UPI00403ACD16